ncbi:MAG TPA: hypothetical protein PKE66_14620 [Pyrinomonadaceae bacterium]|nr:hypothetical protein [Pyrinomonadaceae bacterium]
MSNAKRIGVAATALAALCLGVICAQAQTAGGAAAAAGGGIKRALAAEGGSAASKQFRGGLGSALKAAAAKERTTRSTRSATTRNRTNRPSAPPAGRTAANSRSVPVTTFKPSGSSATFEMLADSIASNQTEREGLLLIFNTTKTAFAQEAKSMGRENNIPAALTFFIITNVTVYNDDEEPSDAAVDKLWDALSAVFEESPELAAMTDREKEEIYDTLIAMSGVPLLGYMQAKETGDREMLASYQQIAGMLIQTVLQVEPGSIRFVGDDIVIGQ